MAHAMDADMIAGGCARLEERVAARAIDDADVRAAWMLVAA